MDRNLCSQLRVESGNIARILQHAYQSSMMLQANHSGNAPSSPTTRSALTNRTRLHDGVDGRSALARRFRDLVASFAEELGGASLSASDMAIARQAAACAMQAEALQANLARGEAVDGDTLVRVTNALARAIAALRGRKPQKPTGSALAQYLAALPAEPADEPADEAAP